jgi:neutral ceramidase
MKLWGIALVLALAVPVAAAEFRAGASAVDITPKVGTPMAGYYSERLAEGTHDPLYAKALVFEQDGEKAAVVVCDLLTQHRRLIHEARKENYQTTGIKGERVMISATHTHTGPVLRDGSPRSASLGGESDLVTSYTRSLPRKIAESVRLAEERLVACRPFGASGHEEGMSHNRRYFMKDGTVGWNPGKLNTNIVKPAGPIDPNVGLLYFEAAAKKPVAAFLNFAMHPDTVGGKEFSADYPFTLAQLLADFKGPEMITIFANGTCGNINHVDVRWADPQKGHTEAARLGTILAGAVMRTFPRLEPVKPGAPGVRSEIVNLPLAEVTPESIENARTVVKRVEAAKQPSFLERVNAFKTLDVAAREGKPLELEVQVIALGTDVAWVGLPGEIFVELGLAIKKASPFRYTFIAELANGSVGYIPNREAYSQGNYEVVSARCAAGSGEMLVESATRMLRELHGAPTEM